MSTRTVRKADGGRRRLARGLALAGAALATALAIAALSAAPAPVLASEGPPERPDTRIVMFVGNNWDGTADIIDARTFKRLARINTIPDKKKREREIRSDPERLAFFLAIRLFVGEGNDQYTDDMFTTHDGTLVAVSRPSFADVVGISLKTGKIVWRFEMEGQRSDHMAVSPDGRRLLVSDSTANKVHELNLRTGRKTGEFPSGDSPHENNYSKDGRRIFHASIGRVYTPTDRCEGELLPEDVSSCFVRDTSKGDRRLQIVDARSLDILRKWRISRKLNQYERRKDDRDCRRGAGRDAPRGFDCSDMDGAVRPMALSPNEKIAYLQVSFHHGFVVFDLERGRVLDVVALPKAPDVPPREDYLLDSAHHGLGINPKGTKLCAAGTMSDYAAMVATDSFEHHIVSRGSKPYWSTTGPNGRHCWVSYSGDDEVVVLDYSAEEEIARVKVGDHPQRVRAGAVRRAYLAELRSPSGEEGGGGVSPPDGEEARAEDLSPGGGSSESGGRGTGEEEAGGSGADETATREPAGDSSQSDGQLPLTGLGLTVLAVIGAVLALGGRVLWRRTSSSGAPRTDESIAGPSSSPHR